MKFLTTLCLILGTAAAGAADLPFQPSFTMKFGSLAEKAPSLTVCAADMAGRTVKEVDGKTVVVWKGHPRCGADFTVTATFAPADGGWSYGFSYEGNGSGLDVEEIGFPELTVPRTDATRCLYPRQTGAVRLPAWKNAKPGARVAASSFMVIGFHFMATLDDELGGWYVDQRDDARLRATHYEFFNGKDPKTVRLVAGYVPPVEAKLRESGSLPFGGVIRPFRGGWYQAAEIYRAWAKTQPWFKAAKARDFGKLRNIALWMWNRGRSAETVPQVEAFMERTGLPAALDWYWWHEIPYDTGYPFFWPPREPEADFRAAVKRLQTKGAYVQTYTNGMLWDSTDGRWTADGEREMIRFRNGKGQKQVFNVFTGANTAWMCGSAPVFQSKLREVEKTLAGCGLDGVYMDMICNCGYGCCWSKEHGHAPGGGRAVADGYRRLVESVRADNPGLQISSEEEGEAFMELVDSMIVLYACYERLGCGTAPEWDMPPIFQAIYHGCVAMFGSYAVIDGITPWDEKWGKRPPIDEEKWAGKFPDQFGLEFARGVVQGVQPCVHKVLPAHMNDPKWAAEWKFVEDTARFYYANRAFLFDGEMRDPGKMTCGTQAVDFFIRGCYTKEEKFRTCRQEALPKVLHSVWQSPDGFVAAVLVNWTKETADYALETPDVTAKGTLPARSWRLVWGRRNLLTNADMAESGGMGDEPAGWSGAQHKNVVDSRVTAKPLGDGAFRLAFEGPRTIAFRQNMLTLKPGAKYRLAAEVRTAGMKGGWASLRLWANGGAEVRLSQRFPDDTKGQWESVEFVTDAPPAPKCGEYYAGFVGCGGATADVRNLRLEPLSDETAAASAPTPAQFASVPYRRIVPIDPLLDKVNAETGAMTFYWPGEQTRGKGTAARDAPPYQLTASVDGGKAVTVALDAAGRGSVPLGKLGTGTHRVRVAVKDPFGFEVAADEYRITAVAPAPAGPKGRRLNNFVTELVCQPLKDGDVTFFRPTDGWVWISFEGDCGDAVGTLDVFAQEVVRRRIGEKRLETQRFVRAGSHTLHVKGAKGGTLRIHAVKPIVGNAYQLRNRPINLSARFVYDLDFARKFDGLGVFNAYTGAESLSSNPAIPDGGFYLEHGAQLYGHGGGANAWNTNRYTFASMYGTLANDSWRRGLDVFIDENSVDVVNVWGHNVERACSINFSETLWRMNEERPDAAVYTYFSDSNYGNWFRDAKCKTSEIACTINTGRGRGWVVPESYAPTFSKEAESARWEDSFAKFFQSATDLVPAAKGRILPWMATYIGLGFWTSYTQPDADIKKHYSRLLRAFATRPEFADIAGIGFGGLGCGDDDITRWAPRILRHYCLEGKADDLADRYGFKWNPGFVKNADFDEGLKGWTAEAASGGAVVGERIAGFGGQQGRQNRQPGQIMGDGIAVFTSSAAGANRLVQTLSGLEVGKHYALQFCVTDYRSIHEKVEKRPPVAFSAALEGATEVKELGYSRPSVGTWARPIRPHLTTCRIVFRADRPTAKLVFADRAADGKALPAGTKQALNYIVFNPYYLETPEQIREVVRWVTKGE